MPVINDFAPATDGPAQVVSFDNPNVYVDETDVGEGVYAARDLWPASWILTVEGPTLSGDHLLAALDEKGTLLQMGPNEYVMPRPPAALVNHSCEPNAGLLNGVHLVAIRPISAGEEIRFDYSTTMNEDDWTLECECGAPSCRGTIEDFGQLPEDHRQTYLDLGIVPSFIARQYRSAD